MVKEVEREQDIGDLLQNGVHNEIGFSTTELPLHTPAFEQNLLEEFNTLNIKERKNLIAALSMFLSAREENAFDRQ